MIRRLIRSAFISTWALSLIALSHPWARGQSDGTSRPAREWPPRVNLIGISEPIVREIESAVAAVEASPRDVATIGRLGMLYFIPAPIAASECFEEALKIEPRSAKWRYYLALSFAASYRRAEAVAALKEALGIEPDNGSFLIRLGDLLLSSDLAAAAQAYEKAVARAPGDARGHYGLGVCAQKKGDVEAALKHYREAIRVYPRYAAAHGAVARIMDQKSQFRDARLHRDQEQTGTPPPPVGDPLYVDLLASSTAGSQLLELVTSLDGSGRTDAAIAILESVTRRDPTDAAVRHTCGMLHGKRGNFVRAAEHFRAVLETHPGQLETVLALGQALARMGETTQAQQLVQEVINSDPKNVAALAVGGTIMLERGRAEQALPFFEKLVELQPRSALFRMQLAACLVSLERYSESLTHYQAARDVAPEGENPAEEFVGRIVQFMADQQRFQVNPGPGVFLLRRANLLELAGQFDSAKLAAEAAAVRGYETRMARAAALCARRGEFGQADALVRAALADARDGGGKEFLRTLRHETESGDVKERFQYATALALSGDLSAAIAEWEAVCKAEPTFEPVYLTWADALGRSGRHADAIAVLKRARAATGDTPLVLNGLAWMLATCADARLRDGEEAVRVAMSACQMTRHENPEMLDTLATAYAAAGDFDKAVATAQEAVRIAGELGMGAAANVYRERLRRFELKAPYEEK